MNRSNSMTRPLIWLMTLLLVAFVTGCLGGIGDTANPTPSSLSSAPKAITAYSLSGSSGVINQTTKSIAVTVPYGTTLLNQVATYTFTGSTVTVGTTAQKSGTTPNNFTSPVTYVVTATDGTTATYIVTITVAAATSKAITVFTFPVSTATTINEAVTPKTIAVTIPYGTGRTALVATFSTSGSSVTVVATGVQTSGTTSNNFSAPLAYTVHAADGSTAIYNVTVTVAGAAAAVICTTGATNCVNLGTSANYVIFGDAGVTNVPTSATTGNIGTSAAASTITGFSLIADSTNVFSTSSQVTGNIYAVDYAAPTPTAVGTASGDMLTAYTAANAVGGGAGVGAACPGGGNFNGLAIAPGVYACGGVTIPGSFTLAGTGAATDVWVFKLTGTLGMTGGSGMTFTGLQGALPQNVFWRVAGAVSIGTNSTLEGIILAATNIDVLAGGIVHGRLLAHTAVNLQGGTNVVTQP